VTWIIRIHSETPFISGEGNAIDWIFKYSKYRNIVISANSERMCDELSNITGKDIVYLPNYYSLPCVEYDYPIKRDTIDIGCFGAIRPFKNHLLQAMAAIKFADDKGLRLRFHINVNRIEGKGEPVLKNIRGLFENRADHELVEHYWSSHAEFIELIKTIDIGMQVSFSETFNIVAADFVSNGKPIVVSKEINWASRISYADPTSFNSMVCALKRVWMLRHIYAQILNEFGLARYNKKSEKIWLNYLANSTDIFDTIVPWENYF
jgi:glycosyltransferase involved in cell wall biosynthesis